MMGTGEATGERRAIEAAESAIANPLLDDVSLRGAKGVLINITGGSDLTLYEVDEAASLIRGQVDPDANIIIGSALDKDLDGIVRISVVATGVESGEIYAQPVADVETHRADEEQAKPRQRPEIVVDNADLASDYEVKSDEISGLLDENVFDDFEAVDSEVETSSQPANPAPFTYQRPNIDASDTPIVSPATNLGGKTIPPVETQTIVKRPFGFFGRKKTKPVAPITIPESATNRTGDLFGSDEDDELEIPSFLRRQNK